MLEIVWGTAAWQAWREELPLQAQKETPHQVHILATRPQLEYTQTLLLEARPAWWGEPAHLIQGFVHAVLNDCGRISPPVVEPQDVLHQFGLASSYLRDLERASGVAAIGDDSDGRNIVNGLSRSLSALILECKRAGLTAEQALKLTAGPRWQLFKSVFRSYEHFLSEWQLSDREDRMNVAIECIRNGESSWLQSISEMWVSGFGVFTPAQQLLLEALIEKVPYFRIYYQVDLDDTEQQQRHKTLQWLRGLAPGRIAEREANRTGQLRISSISLQRSAKPQDEIRGLLDWLRRIRHETNEETVQSGVTDVRRTLKPSLPDLQQPPMPLKNQGEGVRPMQLAITARNPADYAELIARALQAEGWNTVVYERRPLFRMPLVAAFFHLVDLVIGEIDREKLLAALCHPLLANDQLLPRLNDVELGEKMLAELSPFRGWNALFVRLDARIAFLTQKEKTQLAERWSLLRSDLADLQKKLEAWPAAATPMEWVERATFLCELFQLHNNSTWLYEEQLDPASADEMLIKWQRNDAALKQVLEQLKQWGLLQMIVDLECEPLPKTDFCHRLYEFTDQTILLETRSGGNSGNGSVHSAEIQLYEPSQIRGLSFEYMAVLGLREGVFPKIFQNDWLLPDAERRRLAKAGLQLETTDDLRTREKLSFQDLLESCQGRLLLSMNDDDTEHLPEWVRQLAGRADLDEGVKRSLREERVAEYASRAVELLQPEPETAERNLLIIRSIVSNGAVVKSRRAFQNNEAEHCSHTTTPDYAALYRRRQPVVEQDDSTFDRYDGQNPYYSWLQARLSETELAVVRIAQEQAWERESAQYSAWDGNLNDWNIQSYLAQAFPSDYVYSVSQINEYARCPFSFFSRYVLGLEADDEWDDEPEARELGSMVHEALASFLSNYRGGSFQQEQLPAYEHELDEALREAWDRAGDHGREQHGRLWQVQLESWQRRLRYWLRQLVEKNSKDPDGLRPWLLEWSFSPHRGTPLELQPEETGLSHPIYIKGIIDRIDRDENGTFAVYDYKLGEPPKQDAMFDGWEFQIPLYLLAVRRLLPDAGNAAGGGYYSLAKLNANSGMWNGDMRKMLGMSSNTKSVMPREVMEDLLERVPADVGRNVTALRDGQFYVQPHECPSYCAYADICRVGAHGKEPGKKTIERRVDTKEPNNEGDRHE